MKKWEFSKLGAKCFGFLTAVGFFLKGQVEMTKSKCLDDTVPETNSKFAPENGWLEY